MIANDLLGDCSELVGDFQSVNVRTRVLTFDRPPIEDPSSFSNSVSVVHRIATSSKPTVAVPVATKAEGSLLPLAVMVLIKVIPGFGPP
jgi:hypothetical protein